MDDLIDQESADRLAIDSVLDSVIAQVHNDTVMSDVQRGDVRPFLPQTEEDRVQEIDDPNEQILMVQGQQFHCSWVGFMSDSLTHKIETSSEVGSANGEELVIGTPSRLDRETISVR